MRIFVLGSLLMAACGPAFPGVVLNVMETEYTGGPEKAFFSEPDALKVDAQGRSTLLPDVLTDPKHRAMAAILDPGIPFSEKEVRRELGALLSGYPRSCQTAARPFSVTILVSPVEDIDQFVAGVTDRRRITAIYVGDCTEIDLRECSYDRTKTGEVDFHIGMLKGVLRKCRDATNEAVTPGARPANAVQNVSVGKQ